MEAPERGQGRLVARAAEVLREEGPRGLWIRALQHAGIYRRMVVVGRRLEPIPRPRTESVEGMECARLGPDDLDDYLALRPDQDPVEIRRRLEAGHLGSAGRWDGRLVVARWAGIGRVHVDYMGCDLILAPDAYYTYDIYVDPAFRGRDLAGALGFVGRSELASRGYSREIAFIWPENRKAFRRHRRRGGRFAGELVRWQIGGLRRFRLTLEGSPDDPVAWLPPGTGANRFLTPKAHSRADPAAVGHAADGSSR